MRVAHPQLRRVPPRAVVWRRTSRDRFGTGVIGNAQIARSKRDDAPDGLVSRASSAAALASVDTPPQAAGQNVTVPGRELLDVPRLVKPRVSRSGAGRLVTRSRTRRGSVI